MVPANVCSPRGLVNGSHGNEVGIILEPNSMPWCASLSKSKTNFLLQPNFSP